MSKALRVLSLKKKATLIFLILAGSNCLSQVDSVKLNKYYFRHYWTDTRDLIASPLNWDGRDWGKFAIFAGTTAGLFLFDEPVKNFFQERRNSTLDEMSHNFLSPLGGTWSVFISAGFYGAGILAKDLRMQSTGLLAVESFLIGSLIARIPKYALGRVRPDAWWNPDPFEWKGPLGGKSFPSGHTVAAFSVASVFASQYRKTIWVPILSYSLASVAGISRVYENRHWFSDVFAGAVLGIVTGKFICNTYRKEKYAVVPVLNRDIMGMAFVYRI